MKNFNFMWLVIALTIALTVPSAKAQNDFVLAGKAANFTAKKVVRKIVIDAEYFDILILSGFDMVQAESGIYVKKGDEAKGEKIAETFILDMSESGEVVNLKVRIDENIAQFSDDFTYVASLFIVIPDDIEVELNTKYCNVGTDDVGSLRANMEYGKFKADELTGDMTVKSNGTEFEIESLRADATFNSKYGDIYIGSHKGTLNMNLSYMDLNMREGDHLVLNQKYAKTRVFGGLKSCTGKLDFSGVRLYMADGFSEVNLKGMMSDVAVYGASRSGYLFDISMVGLPSVMNFAGGFSSEGAVGKTKEKTPNGGTRETGTMGSPSKSNPSKVVLDFKGLECRLSGY